jgi:hypothetical protein
MTTANEDNADDAVRCTKCGSTQVHAEKRGWRLATGFFGSSKIFITCLKCGNRFRPGEGYHAEEKHDVLIGCLVGLASHHRLLMVFEVVGLSQSD